MLRLVKEIIFEFDDHLSEFSLVLSCLLYKSLRWLFAQNMNNFAFQNCSFQKFVERLRSLVVETKSSKAIL